jgi:effector-binding domain-containing protein
MKLLVSMSVVAMLMTVGTIETMASEETPYEVIEADGKLEIRLYAAHIVAETIVDGSLEDAGSKAFRRLFRYISGDNKSRDKVAMTAPVSQQSSGEKIAMTAPVGQQRVNEMWAVSFTMPASYTLQTLPEPDDPEVTLRQVPARRMATVRYSGFWSEKNYLRYKAELESWIDSKGLITVGDPVWARYNAPFTPWFLRRNEILIPVDSGAQNP